MWKAKINFFSGKKSTAKMFKVRETQISSDIEVFGKPSAFKALPNSAEVASLNNNTSIHALTHKSGRLSAA